MVELAATSHSTLLDPQLPQSHHWVYLQVNMDSFSFHTFLHKPRICEKYKYYLLECNTWLHTTGDSVLHCYWHENASKLWK